MKTIKLEHGEFEYAIIDPTHISLAMVPGSGIPWYYHTGELDEKTRAALMAVGAIDGRGYTIQAEVTEVR